MISVGTDCSGMEAPIQALLQLGIPFRHVFSSECDEACIETIRANYHPDIIYTDMTERDVSKIPPIDLYVCGFPCQPFSHAGKRRGFDDEKRGHLFWHCLEVIDVKRPSYFILENVKGLLTLDEGHTFETIIDELKALKTYDLYWDVLNTKDYGIPHQRERLFIIGIHHRTKSTFEWPEPIECPALDLFIDHTDRKKDPIPSFIQESGILKRLPKDAGYIDIGFPNRTFPNCHLECPCITTQGNLWCVPYKRRANIAEHLKLQGFPETFNQVVSDRQLKKQLGNTISVNVMMALFQHLFPKKRINSVKY